MAKKDSVFSKKIEIVGTLNVDQVYAELNKLQQKLAQATPVDNSKKMGKINRQVADMQGAVDKVMSQSKQGFGSTTEVNNFIKLLSEVATKFQDIMSAMQSLQKQNEQLFSKGLTPNTERFKKQMQDIANSINVALKNIFPKNYTDFTGVFNFGNNFEALMIKLQSALVGGTLTPSQRTGVVDLLQGMTSEMGRYSQSTYKASADIYANLTAQEEVQRRATQSLTTEMQNQQQSVANSTKQWIQYGQTLQSTAQRQASVESGMGALLRRLEYFLSFTSLFYKLRQAFKTTLNDLKNLDKSFGEIAMVTSYSVQDMWTSYEKYAKMANKLGQATNDVVKASVLYYQQGLKTNDVLKLTEDTMRLATLAGSDFSEATDLMTAAIRGFNLEMSDGAHITDVYSELAAHAAASVQEIAVAMNKTAALANSAGMSFENTSAFLTQMIEATQETAVNIGTAMKTIIARFTELKTNVDESDEAIEDMDYNKVDTALKSVGIALKDTNGQMRNLDEVFLELSEKWDGLSRNTQRYIATTAAGSRQQSRFIAMMSNYERTLELVKTAQDSEGRSLVQFEKYGQTIEYSIKQLQNTWEQFRLSIINSDFYNNLIKTGNELLTRVTEFGAKDWTKIIGVYFLLGQRVVRGFFQGVSQASAGINTLLANKFSGANIQQTPSGLQFSKGAMWDPVFGAPGAAALRQNIIKSQAYTASEREMLSTYQGILDRNAAELERLQRSKAEYEELRAAQAYKYLPMEEKRRYSQLKKDAGNVEQQERLVAQQTASVERQQQRVEEAARNQKDFEEQGQALVRQQSPVYQSAYHTLGAAASGAFVGAFTAAMMTDDPGAVWKSSLISGTVAAVPQIVNTFAVSMQANNGLWKSLGTSLSTGVVAGAITIAIAGAAYGIKAWKKNLEEARQRQAELLSSSYSLAKELEDLKKKEEELGETVQKTSTVYKEQADELDSLRGDAGKLSELQKKVILSGEEQEKYISLSNSIAEIAPELVSGYDAEGNALISLGKTYDDLIAKKEETIRLSKLELDQAQAAYYSNQAFAARVELERQQSLAQDLQDKEVLNWMKNLKDDKYYYSEFATEKGIAPSKHVSGQIGQNYFNQNISPLLYQVLQDVSEFSSVTADNDLEYGEAVLKYINKQSDSRREELWKIIFKKLQEAQEVDTTKAEADAQRAIEMTEDTLRKVLGDKIAIDSRTTYQDSGNKNMQTAMEQTAYDIIGLDWDSFLEQYEKDNPRLEGESDKEFEERLYNAWQETIENLELDDNQIKQLQELYNATQQRIWDFVTGSWTADQNIYDKYKSLVDAGISKSALQSWISANREQFTAYNDMVEELSLLIGQKTVSNLVAGIEVFQEGTLGDKLISMGDTAYQKWYEGFKYAAERGWGGEKAFLDASKSLAKDLPSETLGQLFNIDWDSYSIITRDQLRKGFLKNIKPEFKQEAEEAFDLISGFFERDDASFVSVYDSVEEQFDSFGKKAQSVESLAKEYIEKGTVNASTIKTLRKEGMPIEVLYGEDNELDLQSALSYLEEEADAQIALIKLAIQKDEEKLKLWQELLKFNADSLNPEVLFSLGFSNDEISNILTARDTGAFSTYVNEAIKNQELLIENSQSEYRAALALAAGYRQQIVDINKSIADSEKEKAKEVEKANEAVKDAYDDVLKKQQDLIDKQKELEKTLYGDANHKLSNDELYNYQTIIDSLTDSIKDAQDALEDLDGLSPDEYIDKWLAGTRSKKAYLLGENIARSNAINATESALNNQLAAQLHSMGYGVNPSDFYSYNALANRYEINLKALQNARIPDDFKDEISEQVAALNEYKEGIEKTQREIRDLEKEFEQYRKKLRDSYISIQEEVVKKLEEQYKKAIEDKKAMYDGMKEADDEYLSELEKAINKQRQLQERQDQWRELSEKEKRLSLLSRDTSGSTRKDTVKLQKDIEKERRNMLNTAVDDIVSNLKELYEEQQKTHELEIEYQTAVLDNANLIQEANAIINSWKSMDEMTQWMWEHTEGIEKMSDEAVEKLTEDWQDMFDTISAYNAYVVRDIEGALDISAAEIQNIVVNTSETITTEAQRAISEVTDSVTKAIESAKTAVTDAMDALTESQKKYNEAIEELNELIATGKYGSSGDDESSSSQNIDEAKRLAALQSEYDRYKGNPGAQAALQQESGYKLSAKELIDQPVLSYDRTDASRMTKEAKYELYRKAWNEGYFALVDSYGKIYMAKKDTKNSKGDIKSGDEWERDGYKFLNRYKKGGLVNYTGPAWVDGTPSRPESFLNSEDTARIGEAANILRSFAGLGNGTTLVSGLRSIAGDTNVELHFHVDSIATEQQVDYLIDRVKEEVVEAANPIGSAVLLHQ